MEFVIYKMIYIVLILLIKLITPDGVPDGLLFGSKIETEQALNSIRT